MGAVIMINSAAIYSTLGNPNSLIPLLVKDTAATVGMTTGSMITGKEEGQDRLIDEVGTEAIWLCAIPGYKWLFDKTIFKWFGLDSEFDVRNLKNKDIFEKIKKYAPEDKIRKNLEKIEKKQGVFKNLALYKFFFSTGMAIATYFGLTRAKQAYTENKIKRNLIAEFNAKKAKENQNKNDVNSTNPSFKGLGDVAKYFAFSPVRNMWVLDGAITTERLADSRSPQECMGYAIKEASTLCFMYYAGGKIQKYLENKANKKHNKSISLDAKVIESGNLQNAFEDKSVEKSLNDFKLLLKKNEELDKKGSIYKKSGNKSTIELKRDANIYEFLIKNPDNNIVKVAKESDLITMYEKSTIIDTRKFIDIDKIKDTYKNIDTLYTQYKEALKKGATSDEFFSSVKKLKRNSIITNIGTCIFALGVVTPAIMLAKRFYSKDDTEFQTKKEIREQLIKEGVIS